jgi:hypothetical protein
MHWADFFTYYQYFFLSVATQNFFLFIQVLTSYLWLVMLQRETHTQIVA